MFNANALRWDGRSGHYEAYTLLMTDPVTGIGLRIRYSMRAPDQDGRDRPEAAIWFAATTRDGEVRLACKETFGVQRMHAEDEPFRLAIGANVITDTGMRGSLGAVSWELRWQPRLPAYAHVHPLLARAMSADTVLALP